MKPVKHLSTSNDKLASVPELSYKKGLLNLSLSPKAKEKHSAKLVHDKLEPMVLRSPPTGESIVRYALPIPSSKTKELIAEDELLRKITKHLKMVVSTLEETYGVCMENVENPFVMSEQEDLTFSVGNDLNSFLVCCSQFANQLEETVKEEHHILESLFKWFQQQVNQMEEISKDQSFSEAQFSIPDKALTLSIAQIVRHVQKLEELKNHLKEGSRSSWKAIICNSKDSKTLPEAMQSYEKVLQKIEEFIKTHSTEEFMDVPATEPLEPAYLVPKQLNVMLKIFEKQSNMLERAKDDQVLLETKYQQMQNDFQVLSEEKLMLENELHKLKNMEKHTQKTKPTYDRIKKTMKMEKKNTKEKSEDSEEKKSSVKELKTKDFLKAQEVAWALETENKVLQEQLKKALQEAETAQQQLKYFLNQGALLRSDEKNKTTMEKNILKTEVKGEDLKYISETETTKEQVEDSSGRKRNSKIQEYPQISVVHNESPTENRSEKKRASPAISDLSQILKSQDGSAFLKSSDEISADEDQSTISPSECHDESFTRVLQGKEIQDIPSVRGTPLPGNKTETSFIAPPVVTKRKSMGSAISKIDILEEKLQSETENQTYQEGREFQAFPVTQQNDIVSDENQLPEDMDLFLRRQYQTKNVEATRNETFNACNEGPDVKVMLENQEPMSKTQMQEKNKRTRREGLTSHEEVPDSKAVLETQEPVSKTQMQEKNKRTRRDRFSSHEEGPDSKVVLEPQESVSKIQIQDKRKGTRRDEMIFDEDIPDSKVGLEPQESVSKIQIQDSKKGTQRDRLICDEDVPDSEVVREPQESVSKIQIQDRKKGTRRVGLIADEEVPDSQVVLEPRESVPKIRIQDRKKGARRDGLIGDEDVPDSEVVREPQESVSKIQIQDRKKGTRRVGLIAHEEVLNSKCQYPSSKCKKSVRGLNGTDLLMDGIISANVAHDKVSDEKLMHENQDSASKAQLQVKKQRTLKREKLITQDDVTDEKLMLEVQDSISKTQMQVKKQKTPKEEHNTHDGVPEENLLLKQEYSISETEMQVKKKKTSQGERLITHNKVPGEISVHEHQESMSKPQLQVKKRRTSGEAKLTAHVKVPDENPMLEHQDSMSKTQLQVKKQIISKGEILNIHDEVPDKNLILQHQNLVSKIQEQLKKQKSSTGERHNNKDVKELPDKSYTVEDLELPARRLRVKNEAALEIPDTAENLSAMNPSFGEIISQLNLNKVAETDIEHLKGATERHLLVEEMKIQSKSHLETNREQLLNITRKGVTKEEIETQSKSHLGSHVRHSVPAIRSDIKKGQFKKLSLNLPGPSVEHSAPAIRSGIIKGQPKKKLSTLPGPSVEHSVPATGSSIMKGQSLNLPETDRERFPDIIARGIIKGEIKTQSKGRLETDIKNFKDIFGREKILGEIKTKLKNYPGMNFFQNMSIHHQDVFTGPIAPSKFSTNVTNFSDSDKQGMNLFENKNMFSHHQEELFTRSITSSKFPTKVINLSPFKNKETNTEQLLDITGKRMKKWDIKTQSKSHLGHPTDLILKKRNVELKSTLPIVLSKGKTPINKELFFTIWNKFETLRSKPLLLVLRKKLYVVITACCYSLMSL